MLGSARLAPAPPMSILAAGSSQSVVLVALGLLVCMQVLQHLLVRRYLSEDQELVNHPAVEDCASGAGSGNSRRCAELDLFKSWQQHALTEPTELDGEQPEEASPLPSTSTSQLGISQGSQKAEGDTQAEDEQQQAREEALDNLKDAIASLQRTLLKSDVATEEWRLDHPEEEFELAKRGVWESESVPATQPPWPVQLENLEDELQRQAANRGARAEPPGSRGENATAMSNGTVLDWSSASSWKENLRSPAAALRGRASNSGAWEVVSLSRQAMLQTKPRWLGGTAPKVACVTVVPIGRATEEWLQKFIGNFRQQTYEGERVLLLVYHVSDRRTARLVQSSVGTATDVKYAAAHGEKELPSTTSFRFGAWLAEAGTQVIARWDFDAWHAPDRLAMQVRALAMAGRPACMLASWSVLGSTGQSVVQDKGSRWGGTMTGDIEWMHWHWFPSLYGEDASRDSDLRQEHRLVEVAMPELAVYGQQDQPTFAATSE